ncbi:hypothetical protein GOHSU_06_00140 [Gordonia hirsuta DSM 44140 = NBRC 16056]|uniref:Leucine rich repeat variant domain-containing protein n=2 Tax=Gordonia hirsuta TaxID=53427 RepID=L7L8P4_9ACTN|nr:hypothetical protein GOHSU_06_00140 [Gordonia hirsuta DSM 44140 = NBRC 16056]
MRHAAMHQESIVRRCGAATKPGRKTIPDGVRTRPTSTADRRRRGAGSGGTGRRYPPKMFSDVAILLADPSMSDLADELLARRQGGFGGFRFLIGPAGLLLLALIIGVVVAIRGKDADSGPKGGAPQPGYPGGPVPPPAAQDVAVAMNPATPTATLAAMVYGDPRLRPYVAANPATDPGLLQYLSTLRDPAVDQALRSRGAAAAPHPAAPPVAVPNPGSPHPAAPGSPAAGVPAPGVPAPGALPPYPPQSYPAQSYPAQSYPAQPSAGQPPAAGLSAAPGNPAVRPAAPAPDPEATIISGNPVVSPGAATPPQSAPPPQSQPHQSQPHQSQNPHQPPTTNPRH